MPSDEEYLRQAQELINKDRSGSKPPLPAQPPPQPAPKSEPSPKPLWAVLVNKYQSTIFFGFVGLIAAVAFTIWSVQTESRVVHYTNNNSSVVDTYTRKGWTVVDMHTERQAGEIIGRIYYGDSVATVVTLERSNWSKLWND